MSEPLVSIIIINYNGKEIISTCLDSLKTINYKNVEIIVVDNNSSDGSVTLLKENYPYVIIKTLDNNFGFAKPNNIGSEIAKGEFLLFLNNDTKVETNFLNELINAIYSDSKIAICQSLLLKSANVVDSSGDFIDKYGRAFNSKKIPKTISPILSGRGACILVHKKIFDSIGKFNEMFFVSFEDVDLGWRAWLFGYKVVIVPHSIVYHLGGKTIQTMKDKIEFHGVKNTLLLRLLNFESTFLFKSIFVLFFVSISRKLFRLKIISDPESNLLPSSKIIFRGVIWVLKNLLPILCKRKQIQSIRILSTKQLQEMNLIK